MTSAVNSNVGITGRLCIRPVQHPRAGKEAIRQLIEPYIDSPVSVTDNIERIVVASSGDMAYQVGDQHIVMKEPDSEIEGESKYILVWQKLDGKWQCVTMSVTYNEPMS